MQRSKDWIGDNQSSIRVLGARNHTDHESAEYDYYATDPKAAEWLCKLENLRNVWECAAGEGHLAKVFEKYGILGRKSDIVDRTGDTEVLDFLSINESNLLTDSLSLSLYDGSIVTNPPYKYAEQFIRKAFSLVAEGNLVCMFLPIRYLEGKARRRLFEEFPPKVVYVSTSRIPCAMNGDFSNMTGSAVSYAWFVWEKGHKGETLLKWFN